jgi:CDP-paratose 2-epimerase
MKIAITGACGFVGSSLARYFVEHCEGIKVIGMDNLMRPGSETNRSSLKKQGVRILHGDVRLSSDVDQLPKVDWIIDASANPSVLAGIDGQSTTRQLIEHNLLGTLNLLEHCRRDGSQGFILLSSSRVYSIKALASLPMRVEENAFVLNDGDDVLPSGVSAAGISETFSVSPPISLYGSTKLASETMALEYGCTFGFPVWINRCGVLAGGQQFGTADQGIFSYWLHAHAAGRQLRYIGFECKGFQVRDAFHPNDLARLLMMQMRRGQDAAGRISNVGGGVNNAMSLAQLTDWCNARYAKNIPKPDLQPRPFDIPWMIMDSSTVNREFGWEPEMGLSAILDEIAQQVKERPDWLEVSDAIC